jgi:hypothetical protein
MCLVLQLVHSPCLSQTTGRFQLTTFKQYSPGSGRGSHSSKCTILQPVVAVTHFLYTMETVRDCYPLLIEAVLMRVYNRGRCPHSNRLCSSSRQSRPLVPTLPQDHRGQSLPGSHDMTYHLCEAGCQGLSASQQACCECSSAAVRTIRSITCRSPRPTHISSAGAHPAVRCRQRRRDGRLVCYPNANLQSRSTLTQWPTSPPMHSQ